MKEVTIRDFNRKFYQNIKETPVLITKNDEPVYIFMEYSEYLKLERGDQKRVPSYIVEDASKTTPRTV